MAFFFFFTYSEKYSKTFALANSKKGIKVKNSRMGPGIQKEGKGIGVNLKFLTAFDFRNIT